LRTRADSLADDARSARRADDTIVRIKPASWSTRQACDRGAANVLDDPLIAPAEPSGLPRAPSMQMLVVAGPAVVAGVSTAKNDEPTGARRRPYRRRRPIATRASITR
jgi:hypothetical protein